MSWGTSSVRCTWERFSYGNEGEDMTQLKVDDMDLVDMGPYEPSQIEKIRNYII